MNEVPWTWFVMRSSGLVAVGLLTVSVVLGLIGPRLRPTARLSSISVHRAASVAGTLLIVAHIVLALLDKWIVLDWPAALLPGVAAGSAGGSPSARWQWTSLIVVLVTTATRMRTPRVWRRAHLLAYPVWALAVGHGLLVGTDGAVMRAVAMVSAAAVLFGLSIRVLVRPRSVPAGAARTGRGGGSAMTEYLTRPAVGAWALADGGCPDRPRACPGWPFRGGSRAGSPGSCSPPAPCSWPGSSPAAP